MQIVSTRDSVTPVSIVSFEMIIVAPESCFGNLKSRSSNLELLCQRAERFLFVPLIKSAKFFA